jgi:hypothetical protein
MGVVGHRVRRLCCHVVILSPRTGHLNTAAASCHSSQSTSCPLSLWLASVNCWLLNLLLLLLVINCYNSILAYAQVRMKVQFLAPDAHCCCDACFLRPITVYHIEGGSLEPVVTYGEELGKGGAAPINLL